MKCDAALIDTLARMPGAKVLGMEPQAEVTCRSPAKKQAPSPRYTVAEDGMNKGERDYSRHLESLRQAGEIYRWDFEPEKFRLADNTYLRIDFRVLMPDGMVRFVDVKGRSKNTFWAEEDAWLKLKMMAELHPYPVYVTWPRKGGGWDEKLVKRAADEQPGEE